MTECSLDLVSRRVHAILDSRSSHLLEVVRWPTNVVANNTAQCIPLTVYRDIALGLVFVTIRTAQVYLTLEIPHHV